MTRLTVTVDCHDLERAKAFWEALLGYGPVGAGGQYASIGPVEGSVEGPKLVFLDPEGNEFCIVAQPAE